MAKKRVNKALVAAVAGVAVLGGGAYFAADRIKNMMRPVSGLIAAGDVAVQKGDWDTATLNYGKAANREGNNAELQLKFIDALDHTVHGDLDKFRNLRQMQAALLANDPRSVPVLRRVLTFQKNDVQSNPADNTAVRNFKSTAERLLSIVPNDREARLDLVLTVLEPYQRGLEVKPDDIDKQRDEADKLFEEKPDDSDAVRMASVFRRMPLQRAAIAGDLADAQTRAKANLEFADALVRKAPDNPGAWAAFSDINRDAVTLLAQNDPKQREAYAKAFFVGLMKANALVKPDDPMFMQIRTAALRQSEVGDPKAAEDGYRKLLTERPNDRQPRLMLAEFLGRQPARRDEAVALLESPFKPAQPPAALDSLSQRFYGLLEQVRRTSVRIAALTNVTDPAERKKRIDQADKEYRQLISDPDIAQRFKAALLRVQGGLESAQGRYGDAVVTLDSALKILNPDSLSPIDQDIRNDVLQEYAQTQMRLGQTGEARPALEELVRRKPENFGARLVLCDVLIGERSFDAAEQQVSVLERFAPDSPEVKRMRLQLDSQKGDTLKTNYAKLPEASHEDRVLKMQAAGTLRNTDEARRMAKLILTDDPADYMAVSSLVSILASDNDLPSARAVLAGALKAKPDDIRFRTIAANIEADTIEKKAALVNVRVESIKDPYEKAAVQGDLLRSQGKLVDAIEAYKKAEAINRDQPQAYESHFAAALLSRRFADAEAVLPDLQRLDADQAGGVLRRVQLAGARAAVEPDAQKRVKMFADVAVQAQKAAQDHRGLATASQLYANVLMQTGDYNAAIEQFGQTLDKSPRNIDALIGSADSLMRADRRTEARDRLTAARAVAPDDSRLAELEMNYELRFGDPAKAIATLQKQADDRPDDALAALRLGVALDQGSRGRGTDEEQKAMLARAADVYEKAQAKFPQDLRFLVGLMDSSRRLGKPEAAIAAVEKVAADPANAKRPEITALQAEQYVRSARYDDAVRVLDVAVKAVQPPPIELVQQLALIQAQQRKTSDALATLSLRADDAGVQRQRIGLLLDGGDVSGARTAVAAALAGKPDPDTLLLASYVELRGNDIEKAAAYADKVLALRPNEAGAFYYRGQARLARRPPDLDAVRDDLTRARDLSPANPEVRVTLSDVLRARGEADAALAELQAAWNIDHQNKNVLAKLIDAYARATPPAWTAAAKALEEAKATVRLARDPDVLLLEADTFAKRNDVPRAVTAAKSALATDPKNFAMIQRYFDILLRVKAFRDVLSESADSLTAGPQQWWYYHLRAVAFLGLDQKADAKTALDQAFTLAAQRTDMQAIAMVARTTAEAQGAKAAAAKLDAFADPQLQTLAGELLHDDNDINDSIARLEPLLADSAKLPPAVLRRVRQMLGMDYLQADPVQAAKARPVFEALVAQTPNDVNILNNLACVLLMPESGATPADALPVAKRAYDLISGVESGSLGAVVLDTYGWTLVKNGKTNDGLDILRRSAETARFADVFLHLAETYLAAGNVDAAESALADAKARIDESDRAKHPPDPALRARFTQLSADLAKKKPAG